MTTDMTPGAWPRRGLVWPPTEECGSTEGYQEWRERMLQRPGVRAEYERLDATGGIPSNPAPDPLQDAFDAWDALSDEAWREFEDRL